MTYRKRILGYTDRLTVRPGERIDFKVSVEGGAPYMAQLVRLINGDAHSEAANFKEVEIDSPINGRYEGRQQSVAPGSCVVVESVRPLDSADEFTLVINFMPTTPAVGLQHLIGRWDARASTGWSMHIDANGQLSFTVGSRSGGDPCATLEMPLRTGTWHTAVLRVSWPSRSATLYCHAMIRGLAADARITEGSVTSRTLPECPETSSPLMMAAGFGGRDASGRVIPVGCFNGRLEAPVMYRGILADGELTEVIHGERPEALSARLLADWDFSEAIGSIHIQDRSLHHLHGSTHNLPLRAVKGHRWSGTTLEWWHAPRQYAAIHFHADDLYDCGWLTDIRLTVPSDWRSGIYALRLRLEQKSLSVSNEEYLPFYVAAPKGAPRSKIAFLVPTYTYLAYGNGQCAEPDRRESGKSIADYYDSPAMIPGMKEYSLVLDSHSEIGRSLYDCHLDGSGVHFSSWLRPLLSMRPKSILWTLCADLLLIDWLETREFDYDVITDDLLHMEGADLLQGYRVVITGNHPEYHSTQQLDAIESYLNNGGRLMYLGGDGFHKRIAAPPASLPGVVELRRARGSSGPWRSDVGESGFAFSGEVGGSWRELGRPPQRLVGVGTIAWGFGECASYYRVLPGARESRAAFILNGVDGDTIGDFGIFEGGAAGHEIDRTNTAHGTPENALVLARSESHGVAMIFPIEEMRSLDPVIDHYRSQIAAELTFFETRNGGAVFSVGSMTWCGSLSHNSYSNSVSTITENVISRFLERSHYPAVQVGTDENDQSGCENQAAGESRLGGVIPETCLSERLVT